VVTFLIFFLLFWTGFDLNLPLDDFGAVDFDYLQNLAENDDGDAGFDLNEPADAEHGIGTTSCSSLVHVLHHVFLFCMYEYREHAMSIYCMNVFVFFPINKTCREY